MRPQDEEMIMSISELIPAIQSLSRAEKVQLLQVIAAEIAQDEELSIIPPRIKHEVWSPYDAFDAAEQLINALKSDQHTMR
jgi:hypothetical protein